MPPTACHPFRTLSPARRAACLLLGLVICATARPADAQKLVAVESPARPLRVIPDADPPILHLTAPPLDAQDYYRTEADSIALAGTLEDASGVARLLFGGELVPVQDGRFSRTVRLKEGFNAFSLVAEDRRGNVVTRELTIERVGRWAPETADQIPDGPVNPQALAVAIGIEQYRSLPGAPFAENDARRFAEYARRAFGVPSDRTYLALNEKATLGELRKIFDARGWLDRRVTPDSDVYVFFSGHGFRHPETDHDAYLLPYEAEPLYVGMNFALRDLYDALGNLPARSVTVFVDACFSGITRGRDLLVAGARGPTAFDIRTTLEGAELRYPTLLVFSAADDVQFSGTDQTHRHGLFTYFLLRGLRGEADDVLGNDDGIVTADELIRFTEDRVRKAALETGHEQTPVLAGRATDRPLVRY